MSVLRKISILILFVGILTSCNKEQTTSHVDPDEKETIRSVEDIEDMDTNLETENKTEKDGEAEDQEGKDSKSNGETEHITDKKDSILTVYDIEDGYIQVPYLAELEHHNYDWNFITNKEGYKYYQDSNNRISTIGIDVSKYQGDIVWEKVRESGIEFVIIRLGFRGYGSGQLVLDEYFIQNIEGALEVGIKVGVYFFSQAITVEEAVEEAGFVYDHIKSYDITYPVVFDTEEIKNNEARTDGLEVEELTQITIAFCEKIKEWGYMPMIYANAKWLTTQLDLMQLTDYEIWYADYQEEPIYPYQFRIWQYTEEGSVPGIDGYVDLNVCFEGY